MFIFWIIVIAAASIIWAFFALKRERNKKELEEAKKDITRGRVVFHSSDVSPSKES